jgi:hypothetical protein
LLQGFALIFLGTGNLKSVIIVALPFSFGCGGTGSVLFESPEPFVSFDYDLLPSNVELSNWVLLSFFLSSALPPLFYYLNRTLQSPPFYI